MTKFHRCYPDYSNCDLILMVETLRHPYLYLVDENILFLKTKPIRFHQLSSNFMVYDHYL